MPSNNKSPINTAHILSFLILAATVLYQSERAQPHVLSVVANETSTPVPARTAVMQSIPQIILQRLQVTFLGQDGHKLIGSGCPGSDGEGSIVDYHLTVSNVDADRSIARIVVAGDNSTLTWAWPCTDNWGLLAIEAANGEWDIFIAPSEPARIYTVMFFYSDHTMALGMTTVP